MHWPFPLLTPLAHSSPYPPPHVIWLFVRPISSHPEIVLLDVGMTAELSPNYRANMVNFFRALSKRNGRDAAIYTLRFSSQQSCPDPQAFVDVSLL